MYQRVCVINFILFFLLPSNAVQHNKQLDDKLCAELLTHCPRLPAVLVSIIAGYAKKLVWEEEQTPLSDSWQSVAWSPRGTQLAVVSRHALGIWNVCDDGKFVLSHLLRHDGIVLENTVAWSPCGTQIAVGCADHTGIVVNVFDHQFSTSNPVMTVPMGVSITSLAWSPVGDSIASGDADGAIRMLDVQRKHCTVRDIDHQYSDKIASIAWAPCGTQFVAGSEDGTVNVYHVRSGGTTVCALSKYSHVIRSVAWSSSGKYIAAGACGCSNSWMLWKYEGYNSKLLHRWRSDEGGICTCADGRVAFIPGSDDLLMINRVSEPYLQIWSAELEKVATIPSDPVRCIALSPCGMKFVVDKYFMNKFSVYNRRSVYDIVESSHKSSSVLNYAQNVVVGLYGFFFRKDSQ